MNLIIYHVTLGPKQTITKNKKFFVQGVTDVINLTSAINELGGKITSRRALADFIVCDDITKPGLRNEIAMVLVLKGGCIISSSCFATKPGTPATLQPGTRIAFKSPLDQPKWIYISPDFKLHCPGIDKVIRDALEVQPKPRRWKLLSYDDVIVGN